MIFMPALDGAARHCQGEEGPPSDALPGQGVHEHPIGIDERLGRTGCSLSDGRRRRWIVSLR